MKGDQNEFPISHFWLSFLLFLAGCSWDEGASAEPSDPVNGEQEPPVIAEVDPLSAQAPVSNPIDVTGPITLSRNPLFHLTGRDEYLSVVQVNVGIPKIGRREPPWAAHGMENSCSKRAALS